MRPVRGRGWVVSSPWCVMLSASRQRRDAVGVTGTVTRSDDAATRIGHGPEPAADPLGVLTAARCSPFLAADHLAGQREVSQCAARLLIVVQGRLAEARRLRQPHVAGNDGAKHLVAEMLDAAAPTLRWPGCYAGRTWCAGCRRSPAADSGPALICSIVLTSAVSPSSA